MELLAAQHLDISLDATDSGLIPPSGGEAAGEYELGTVSYAGRTFGPFGLREAEWPSHVGIFGRSGAGKTNIGFLVVQKLVRHDKPVLIFDWKRNYRDLLGKPGFEGLAVFTIGRSAAPLTFNPLIPPPQTPPKTWLKKIIAVIAHAYLLGDGVLYLLQEALDRVYTDAGVYAGSVQHWPTFRDVYQVLKQRPVAGRESGWMSSALRALSSLCFGEMDALFNTGTNNLEALLTRPVVLELDSLTQSDKVMFVQAVLLWVHHYRMAEGTRERFKHAIVIEEAHHILSNERQSLVGGQSVMELTFREIREFGESMVILDQQPSSIAASALANTNATICFNVKHRSDVNAISQAMLLQDDQKDILGRLPVGEAVVRLQGRTHGPFTIRVPEFEIYKGSVTDNDVAHQMIRIGLISARSHHIGDIPASHRVDNYFVSSDVTEREDGASEPSEVVGPAPSLPTDPKEARQRAFLLDVARYADSGVAERFRRLGLSVRQGQKIKERLIGQQLICEELKTTRYGRVRIVRLTEQGQLLLHDGHEDRQAA
ncbi:MAG: ATP-binding protein [Phycisphaeraceae bacterium]|nr:ATP-binding protein [Phycisphaeraceae bacterium]